MALVISEIMYDPNSAEDNWEWVEVFNDDPAASVDLSGYVLDDINSVAHTAANIAGGVLDPLGSGILYNADDVTAADFAAAWGTGINLVPVTNWSAMALNNGGDQVGLWSSFAAYDGDNTVHANAEVSIDYGLTGFADPAGSSIYLTDLAADATDGANWAASADGVATPLGAGYTSAAEGGNIGTDVGSPGGTLPTTPPTTPPVSPPASVVINEIDADTVGTDEAEFVELFGAADTALDGLTLVFFNGNGDTSYAAFDLDGFSLDADGYFVAGNSAVAGVDLTFDPNTLQNGADAVALYTADATDFPNGTAVTQTNLVDAIVYDTNDADDAELLAGLGQTIQVNEGGGNGSAVDSLQRIPNGTGAFEPQAPTPDAENGIASPPPPPPPPAAEVAIFDIQGAGHTSPLLGQAVATSGIVTAVDTNGFYLQDATGDDDIATSDAIFVFTNSAPAVSVGDAIEVTGTVSEFFPGGQQTGNLSTTQISGNPVIALLSSGNDLPAATIIGASGRVPPSETIDDDNFTSFDPETDGIDFFESLEAMRVTGEDLVAVAGTNQFGEIFTVANGGADATGISERGTLNISPDDFNPEKIQIDEDTGILDFAFPDVAVGDTLGDVTGVVSYSFGNFEILPTEDFTDQVVSQGLVPETSAIEGTGERLSVASYNVLNLDPNDADGDTDVADGRFDTIAAQIVDNLNAPDVIALQEIQDNSGSDDDGVVAADQTLQALVDAIAAAGGPVYSIIDNNFIGDNTSGGQPGGNIRTAFLYDASRVGHDPASVQTIGDQDPGGAFEGARLPLVASFTFNEQDVTLVNNHFSSKGGSAPILGVEQPFEARQEDVTVNGSLDERQAQSQAVRDYVDGLLAAEPGSNVVVLGDLNEFEFVSPVSAFEPTLTNLTNGLPEDERYSFIFQGNSQSLDHILVSDSLAAEVEFDAVHTNSEFAVTDASASDHDPLLASFALGVPAPDVADDLVIAFLPLRRVEISLDGEVVQSRRVAQNREELEFRLVELEADEGRLRFENDNLGIFSREDRGRGKDTPTLRGTINGEEALEVELEDDDEGAGSITRVTLELGEVVTAGTIRVEGEGSDDDEVLLAEIGIDEGTTSVTFDVDQTPITELEIKAGDGAAFSLSSIGLDLDTSPAVV